MLKLIELLLVGVILRQRKANALCNFVLQESNCGFHKMVQKEMLKHVTLKSRMHVLAENVIYSACLSSTIWQALRNIAHPMKQTALDKCTCTATFHTSI